MSLLRTTLFPSAQFTAAAGVVFLEALIDICYETS